MLNNLELIIVDGGSSDGTLAAVRATLGKTSARSLVFQEIHGLGFARNLVVKNATGKYIIWVDADMALPKDHVRKQIEFMEELPKSAIGKVLRRELREAEEKRTKSGE